MPFQYQLNIISPPPTVLRFVGPTDNVYSCSFVQMLEQRLENAFDEAQDKVLETYNRLAVEVRRRGHGGCVVTCGPANKANSIQFSIFYISQYPKLQICLRGLYSLYTNDIPDL